MWRFLKIGSSYKVDFVGLSVWVGELTQTETEQENDSEAGVGDIEGKHRSCSH